MHRVILMMLLAVVSSSAMSEETAAIAFDRLVKTGYKLMTSSNPVQEGKGFAEGSTDINNLVSVFAKRSFVITNLTYDAKQSSSVLTPIVGFVKFNVVVNESASVRTKGEALRATRFNEERKYSYDVLLTYGYSGNTWKFKSCHVEPMSYNKPDPYRSAHDLTEEDIITNNSFVQLNYWLPQ